MSQAADKEVRAGSDWKAKIMEQVGEAKQELQAAESAIGSLTVRTGAMQKL